MLSFVLILGQSSALAVCIFLVFELVRVYMCTQCINKPTVFVAGFHIIIDLGRMCS